MNKTRGILKPLSDSRRRRQSWYFVLIDGEGVRLITEFGDLFHADPGTEANDLIAKTPGIGFTENHKSLLAATMPTTWTAKQRRHRVLEMRHDSDSKVNILPAGLLDDFSGLDRFLAIQQYMEWLRENDVFVTARTGWNTLGRHLYQSTLTRPVRFFGLVPGGRQIFYGGRKSAPWPMAYSRAAKYDISAAYAHSLGTAPMPRALRQMKRACVGSGDGFAFVTATVPEMAFPPLPERADRHSVAALRWKTGEITGWHSFGELRHAMTLGVKLTVHSSYEGYLYHDDFARWFEVVQQGRALGLGAKLAKHHANLLWSSFGAGPSPIYWKRYDENRKPILIKMQKAGPDFRRGEVYLPALIASRVRTRLHREALAPGGRERRTVIHCDTDGFIGGQSEDLPTDIVGLGSWRRVKDIPYIEVKSPNSYRYRCNDCGTLHAEWHYSVAGAKNQDSLRRAFRRSPRTIHQEDPASVLG